MFRFKKGRTTLLLDEFRRMDPRLQFIALSMMGFAEFHFGKDLVVTEIFRTEQQQRDYYPGRPYRASVHQYGRGIDFGVREYREAELDAAIMGGLNSPHPGFSDKEINLLDEWYSKIVSYDDERPDFDSIVHHNVGLGDHFHIQVSWRNSTRLKSDVPTLKMLAERLGITLPRR